MPIGYRSVLLSRTYVGSGEVRPESEKLKSFPTLKTKKEVRIFLGLTGYYQKYIPSYLPLLEPNKKEG